jgi:hypothetical protein
LPVYEPSYRHQQPVFIEYALRAYFFDVNNNLAVELSLSEFDAFNPLPFNAAADTQWIYHTHWMTFLVAPL